VNIAVIGAGLAGLATCFHVLTEQRGKVTIFDEKAIGGSTSGMAAGLVHPFHAKEPKKVQNADTYLKEAHALFHVAQDALQDEIILHRGIFRPALSEKEKQVYIECARSYSDCSFEHNIQIPFVDIQEGLLIHSGLALDTKKYIQGLWLACQKKGATFVQKKIQNLDEVSLFDRIILAMGAQTKQFAETAHLPMKYIKGQLLELTCSSDIPSYAINGNCYAVFRQGRCFAGSTFERHRTDLEPTKNGEENIRLRLKEFSIALSKLAVQQVHVGVRAYLPDSKPYVEKLSEKLYCITGLGSKGLLYHASFAKQLTSMLFS
jgi:glycine/D-amino acid oxidase-like deaminating enzyme